MKISELRQLIRSELLEAIVAAEAEQESAASREAKQKGLDSMGWGRYGKDGVVTHRSVKGKLEPVDAEKVAKQSGLTTDPQFKPDRSRRPHTHRYASINSYPDKKDDTFGHIPKSDNPTYPSNVRVAKYDPSKGKFNSMTADKHRKHQQFVSKQRDRFGTDDPSNDPLTAGMNTSYDWQSVSPKSQPIAKKVMSRIEDKYAQFLSDYDGDKGYYISQGQGDRMRTFEKEGDVMNTSDFLKATGITPKEFAVATRLDKYQSLWRYNKNANTVEIVDNEQDPDDHDYRY